jgi:uncharacterized protein (DUF1800 family)
MRRQRLPDWRARVAWLGSLTSAFLLAACLDAEAPATRTDASRMLAQASFGASGSEVDRVARMGLKTYLSEQFAIPPTEYSGFYYVPETPPANCAYDGAHPTSPASLCYRDNYTIFQVQRQFFEHAADAPDQLRQRVAFALSQILVVSANRIPRAYGMAGYQNLLIDHAFGNYRDILYEVTLSPVMGHFLDMVNNDKANAARGTKPNENYAREVLQLFSIGTVKLNIDGSVQRDAKGQPITTYTQEVIDGFAQVFTGWTYPTLPGAMPQVHNPVNYAGRMEPRAATHDTASKLLLDEVKLPANQAADADLNQAIGNIFNHPNVGPFLALRLIQNLITSNPSPRYIARVARVFNNNGLGVRGDMKAVVRAVLLDREARGGNGSERPDEASQDESQDDRRADRPDQASREDRRWDRDGEREHQQPMLDPQFGKLRDPALFVAAVVRGLGAKTDGVFLRTQSAAMGQDVYNAASVFSFYSPFYPLPGASLLGPEFGVLNSSTVVARVNFLERILYGGPIPPDPTVSGSRGTVLDLSASLPLAGDPARLVKQLSDSLVTGGLSDASSQVVVNAVSGVVPSDPLGRVRLANYLILSSSQFQVER